MTPVSNTISPPQRQPVSPVSFFLSPCCPSVPSQSLPRVQTTALPAIAAASSTARPSAFSSAAPSAAAALPSCATTLPLPTPGRRSWRAPLRAAVGLWALCCLTGPLTTLSSALEIQSSNRSGIASVASTDDYFSVLAGGDEEVSHCAALQIDPHMLATEKSTPCFQGKAGSECELPLCIYGYKPIIDAVNGKCEKSKTPPLRMASCESLLDEASCRGAEEEVSVGEGAGSQTSRSPCCWRSAGFFGFQEPKKREKNTCDRGAHCVSSSKLTIGRVNFREDECGPRLLWLDTKKNREWDPSSSSSSSSASSSSCRKVCKPLKKPDNDKSVVIQDCDNCGVGEVGCGCKVTCSDGYQWVGGHPQGDYICKVSADGSDDAAWDPLPICLKADPGMRKLTTEGTSWDLHKYLGDGSDQKVDCGTWPYPVGNRCLSRSVSEAASFLEVAPACCSLLAQDLCGKTPSMNKGKCYSIGREVPLVCCAPHAYNGQCGKVVEKDGVCWSKTLRLEVHPECCQYLCDETNWLDREGSCWGYKGFEIDEEGKRKTQRIPYSCCRGELLCPAEVLPKGEKCVKDDGSTDADGLTEVASSCCKGKCEDSLMKGEHIHKVCLAGAHPNGGFPRTLKAGGVDCGKVPTPLKNQCVDLQTSRILAPKCCLHLETCYRGKRRKEGFVVRRVKSEQEGGGGEGPERCVLGTKTTSSPQRLVSSFVENFGNIGDESSDDDGEEYDYELEEEDDVDDEGGSEGGLDTNDFQEVKELPPICCYGLSLPAQSKVQARRLAGSADQDCKGKVAQAVGELCLQDGDPSRRPLRAACCKGKEHCGVAPSAFAGRCFDFAGTREELPSICCGGAHPRGGVVEDYFKPLKVVDCGLSPTPHATDHKCTSMVSGKETEVPAACCFNGLLDSKTPKGDSSCGYRPVTLQGKCVDALTNDPLGPICCAGPAYEGFCGSPLAHGNQCLDADSATSEEVVNKIGLIEYKVSSKDERPTLCCKDACGRQPVLLDKLGCVEAGDPEHPLPAICCEKGDVPTCPNPAIAPKEPGSSRFETLCKVAGSSGEVLPDLCCMDLCRDYQPSWSDGECQDLNSNTAISDVCCRGADPTGGTGGTPRTDRVVKLGPDVDCGSKPRPYFSGKAYCVDAAVLYEPKGVPPACCILAKQEGFCGLKPVTMGVICRDALRGYEVLPPVCCLGPLYLEEACKVGNKDKVRLAAGPDDTSGRKSLCVTATGNVELPVQCCVKVSGEKLVLPEGSEGEPWWFEQDQAAGANVGGLGFYGVQCMEGEEGIHCSQELKRRMCLEDTSETPVDCKGMYLKDGGFEVIETKGSQPLQIKPLEVADSDCKPKNSMINEKNLKAPEDGSKVWTCQKDFADKWMVEVNGEKWGGAYNRFECEAKFQAVRLARLSGLSCGSYHRESDCLQAVDSSGPCCWIKESDESGTCIAAGSPSTGKVPSSCSVEFRVEPKQLPMCAKSCERPEPGDSRDVTSKLRKDEYDLTYIMPCFSGTRCSPRLKCKENRRTIYKLGADGSSWCSASGEEFKAAKNPECEGLPPNQDGEKEEEEEEEDADPDAETPTLSGNLRAMAAGDRGGEDDDVAGVPMATLLDFGNLDACPEPEPSTYFFKTQKNCNMCLPEMSTCMCEVKCKKGGDGNFHPVKCGKGGKWKDLPVCSEPSANTGTADTGSATGSEETCPELDPHQFKIEDVDKCRECRVGKSCACRIKGCAGTLRESNHMPSCGEGPKWLGLPECELKCPYPLTLEKDGCMVSWNPIFEEAYNIVPMDGKAKWKIGEMFQVKCLPGTQAQTGSDEATYSFEEVPDATGGRLKIPAFKSCMPKVDVEQVENQEILLPSRAPTREDFAHLVMADDTALDACLKCSKRGEVCQGCKAACSPNSAYLGGGAQHAPVEVSKDGYLNLPICRPIEPICPVLDTFDECDSNGWFHQDKDHFPGLVTRPDLVVHGSSERLDCSPCATPETGAAECCQVTCRSGGDATPSPRAVTCKAETTRTLNQGTCADQKTLDTCLEAAEGGSPCCWRQDGWAKFSAETDGDAAPQAQCRPAGSLPGLPDMVVAPRIGQREEVSYPLCATEKVAKLEVSGPECEKEPVCQIDLSAKIAVGLNKKDVEECNKCSDKENSEGKLREGKNLILYAAPEGDERKAELQGGSVIASSATDGKVDKNDGCLPNVRWDGDKCFTVKLHELQRDDTREVDRKCCFQNAKRVLIRRLDSAQRIWGWANLDDVLDIVQFESCCKVHCAEGYVLYGRPAEGPRWCWRNNEDGKSAFFPPLPTCRESMLMNCEKPQFSDAVVVKGCNACLPDEECDCEIKCAKGYYPSAGREGSFKCSGDRKFNDLPVCESPEGGKSESRQKREETSSTLVGTSAIVAGSSATLANAAVVANSASTPAAGAAAVQAAAAPPPASAVEGPKKFKTGTARILKVCWCSCWEKWGPLMALFVGGFVAAFNATQTGGNVWLALIPSFLALIIGILVWTAKPDSPVTRCLASMKKCGDNICENFWPRLGFAISILAAISIPIARPDDWLSYVSSLVLALGSFAELTKWKVPMFDYSDVPVSCLVYGFGTIFLILATLLKLILQSLERSNVTTLTATTAVAKVIAILFEPDDEELPLPEQPPDEIELAELGEATDADVEPPNDSEPGKSFEVDNGEGEVEAGGEDLPDGPSCPAFPPLTMEVDPLSAEALKMLSSFGEFFLEPWRGEALGHMLLSMHASRAVGGLDKKFDEKPCEHCPDIAKAREFASTVRQAWLRKPGTLLDELCGQLLKQPAAPQAPQPVENMTKETLKVLSNVCHARFSKLFDPEFADLGLGHLCVYTYTMQDVDVDRFCLFHDVCDFPVGRETPAERDAHYRDYRDYHGKRRNLQLFQHANLTMRRCWDNYVRLTMSEEWVQGMTEFIKWEVCISVLRQKLPKPITTSRGLCGLPEMFVKEFRAKKPGDYIFWPALSSTTTDPVISESYANQQEPVDRNILFIISGVNEGLHLMQMSAYPNEKEFLLPVCSLLKVEKVVVEAPTKLYCHFEGTLLPKKLQIEALEELKACMAELDELKKASSRAWAPTDHGPDVDGETKKEGAEEPEQQQQQQQQHEETAQENPSAASADASIEQAEAPATPPEQPAEMTPPPDLPAKPAAEVKPSTAEMAPPPLPVEEVASAALAGDQQEVTSSPAVPVPAAGQPDEPASAVPAAQSPQEAAPPAAEPKGDSPGEA